MPQQSFLSWLFSDCTEQLNRVLTNQEAIMATLEQHTAALGRIEAATTKGAEAATAIAERMQALEDLIKTMGLSQEQEEALLAQTEGIATNAETLATSLEAMGKTPESPVPEEPPPPLEVRRKKR